MHTVDIKVHKICQTRVDRDAVQKWLYGIGVREYEVPVATSHDFSDEHVDCTDAALAVAMAGKRCYMSFEPGLNPNITKVRKDLCDYLDNILKSGHGSVLEHVTWTFAVEGVSRVFTGEMNRHRAGWAISEGSMRYIRFDDIPFWMPESIKNDKGKNKATREIFQECFKHAEMGYKALCQLWGIEEMKDFSQKKKLTSLFRRIIPMGVATGGIWTGNARALRHVIALRTDPGAEEEIAYVFGKIAKQMVKDEPMLFGDFSEIEGAWVPKYPKV